jgi:alpha-tubulin suppressor-like RCC1 family protein
MRQFHLGLLDIETNEPDTKSTWRTLGFDLDGRCTTPAQSPQGDMCQCTGAGNNSKDVLVDGDDCRDNNFGKLFSNFAAVTADIRTIESKSNTSFEAGGPSVLLVIEDIGPDADDPYAPARLYLTRGFVDDPPKWDGTDAPRVDGSSVDGGVTSYPRQAFPNGYIRNNVWVSGDLGAPSIPELRLPLSANIGMGASNLITEIPTSTLTIAIDLEAEPGKPRRSNVGAITPVAELVKKMFPLVSNLGKTCDDVLIPQVLQGVLALSGDLSLANEGGGVFCDAASLGMGIEWSEVQPPVDASVDQSAAPPPNCDVCVAGEIRCAAQQASEVCDADGHRQVTACGPDKPQCVDGACVQIAQLSLAEDHSCARLSDGTVRCWGLNDDGGLGHGVNKPSTDAWRPITTLIDGVTDLDCHGKHCCAVRGAGEVHCWGFTLWGQLGSNVSDGSTPLLVEGLGKATRLALGTSHSCALLEDRTVACWGTNAQGQLGDGDPAKPAIEPTPRLVKGLDQVDQLVAGDNHTCALRAGKALCWGRNAAGQGELGVGSQASVVATPAEVKGLEKIKQLLAFGQTTLALLEDGTVMGWGNSAAGQLGTAALAAPSQPLPIKVEGVGPDVVELYNCSKDAAFARLADGTMLGWGLDYQSQLTVYETQPNTIMPPTAFPDLQGLTRLNGEGAHACGIGPDGRAFCWGTNKHGQCGDGTNEYQFNVPRPVLF